MQPNNEIDKLRRNWGRKPISGKSWRAGVSQRQLVVIMCAAALVGITAVVLDLFTPDKSQLGSPVWQCLKCNDDFTSKSTDIPPIECPKCGGEAVLLGHRLCPGCDRYALLLRKRLTKQGQVEYAAIKAGRKDRGDDGGPTGILMLPMEAQYWVTQPDGSRAWTGWMITNSPMAMQLRTTAKCSHCEAYLTRYGRSAKGEKNR